MCVFVDSQEILNRVNVRKATSRIMNYLFKLQNNALTLLLYGHGTTGWFGDWERDQTSYCVTPSPLYYGATKSSFQGKSTRKKYEKKSNNVIITYRRLRAYRSILLVWTHVSPCICVSVLSTSTFILQSYHVYSVYDT